MAGYRLSSTHIKCLTGGAASGGAASSTSGGAGTSGGAASGAGGSGAGGNNLGLLQALSVSFNGYDFSPVGVRIVASTAPRPSATPTSPAQGLGLGLTTRQGLVSSFVEAPVPPPLADGK